MHGEKNKGVDPKYTGRAPTSDRRTTDLASLDLTAALDHRRQALVHDGARLFREHGVHGRFRIIDPACLDVLKALKDAFDEEGLAFAIAGGLGAQALLAAAGLDHLLRTTGGVDVVVKGDDARIVRALNHLAAEHRALTVVQNPPAKNARVGPMNVDWINEPSRLRGLEDAFVDSIERARVVRVRQLELPVQEPEFLVAAKLTGQKVRPQDELDIAAVLESGVDLDETRLRALVASRPDRLAIYDAIRTPREG